MELANSARRQRLAAALGALVPVSHRRRAALLAAVALAGAAYYRQQAAAAAARRTRSSRCDARLLRLPACVACLLALQHLGNIGHSPQPPPKFTTHQPCPGLRLTPLLRSCLCSKERGSDESSSSQLAAPGGGGRGRGDRKSVV